ncbi:pseudouridine synthase [Terrimonas alba]|uniref:pseudouridine synthase n=1 Tax=Terrimonas alba TaxID=3349636 RepID=UPI0035F260B3
MKKKSTPFDKFAKKKSNAAIKEQFKQEKRKIKKEREEYFEQKRAEARKQKLETGRQRSQVTGQKSKVKGQREEVRSQKTEVRSQRPEVINRNQLATGDRQLATLMPLNKFLAHSGVAARREAAEIVKQGRVKVNKVVITEPGHKVTAQDDIRINGKRVFVSKNLVYILLNKPKDYITTTDDPQGRKTVLDIIGNAITERIYPVGRLDRNTSGVLLLTNDGELSQKLTHPSNQIKKVYHVTLNKPLEKKDFEKILNGVTLEDGPASVDVLAYADIKDKTQIGVEIHSGRNRIVRRIFESLGYDVKNLDRVIFAGLTKKNVERGKWRFLTEKEVRDLKHFGKGK